MVPLSLKLKSAQSGAISGITGEDNLGKDIGMWESNGPSNEISPLVDTYIIIMMEWQFHFALLKEYKIEWTEFLVTH
jgi:hypothetical protein